MMAYGPPISLMRTIFLHQGGTERDAVNLIVAGVWRRDYSQVIYPNWPGANLPAGGPRPERGVVVYLLPLGLDFAPVTAASSMRLKLGSTAVYKTNTARIPEHSQPDISSAWDILPF